MTCLADQASPSLLFSFWLCQLRIQFHNTPASDLSPPFVAAAAGGGGGRLFAALTHGRPRVGTQVHATPRERGHFTHTPFAFITAPCLRVIMLEIETLDRC